MYFSCTIQPELTETQNPDYIGSFLTVKDKKKIIDYFYKLNKNIPLIFTHKVIDEYGALVSPKDRIGKANELFLDKDGDLIGICKMEKYDDDGDTVSSDSYNTVYN